MDQQLIICIQETFSKFEISPRNVSSCSFQDNFVIEKSENCIVENNNNVLMCDDVMYSQDEYCSPIQLWIEEICKIACHFGREYDV
jgi:hypothetical protein